MEELLLLLKFPSSSLRLVPSLLVKQLKQPRKIKLNEVKENMDILKIL